MDWRDNIIREIGEGMGVQGLGFGDQGVVCFEFESNGSLFMEQQESGVLVYLRKEIDAYNPLPVMEKALRECHYTNSFPWSLQAAIKDDQLFISLFMIDDQFNRPSVENAMQYLLSKADQLT